MPKAASSLEFIPEMLAGEMPFKTSVEICENAAGFKALNAAEFKFARLPPKAEIWLSENPATEVPNWLTCEG